MIRLTGTAEIETATATPATHDERLVITGALAWPCGLRMGNAHADPVGSSTQDDTYFRQLTTPGGDGFFITVTNPSTAKD